MSTIVKAIFHPGSTSKGFWRWLATTNHKDIGILYILSSFFFFIVGGVEALILRIQLGTPDNTFVTPDVYNQIFTMHGTTMIFLFVMPILVGFGNYLVPLMIGARDMAFPRLNALSYWMFIFGGLLLYSSFLFGGAPDAGWFAYAPLTISQYSHSHGMDFWALGITLTGIGSTVGAINFIVTILNLRAPGMTLFKMPLFVWQILVTAFLLVFALPSLTVDAILLFLERNYGALFFAPSQGGSPLLWQHLFWFFGHPEVYILILPAFGFISEIMPTFSRKPIFGYGAIVFSGIAIGFLGFTVWAHHMFAVGLSPIADAIFSIDSMIIAVPTSIKIFNWIATLWGGKLNVKTPLLFAVGFVSLFIIGGLSGITLAVVPIDFQVTDSYYIVAHLHYVLYGGSVFAIFAAIYYWFPKMTGRLLNETLGKWHFWTMFAGFNLTFFPMHALGLMGMPRRIFTYSPEQGWTLWNFLETIGAFVIAISILVFLWNLVVSLRKGKEAGDDPWDAQTLEWTVSSPPPEDNFAVIPTITSRRPLWDKKHPHLGGQSSPEPAQLEVAPSPAEPATQVHHQAGSFFPIILAFGLFLASFAMVFKSWFALIGVVVFFFAVIGWTRVSRKIQVEAVG